MENKKQTLQAVRQLLENAKNSASMADTLASDAGCGCESDEIHAIYSLVNGTWDMLYGICKAFDRLYKHIDFDNL